jgi:competence protein ComGC
MDTRIENKAYTLVEVLIATVFSVILVGAVVNAYSSTKQIYSTGIAGGGLQDGANAILTKMIGGKSEPTGTYRLEEAVSYTIPSLSQLNFVGTDAVQRWYYLNAGATAVLYHHPTAGGTINETIYTAPANTIITLRFSAPSGAQYTGVVVGIDVALSQVIFGQTVTGSASTYVNIRNHAV